MVSRSYLRKRLTIKCRYELHSLTKHQHFSKLSLLLYARWHSRLPTKMFTNAARNIIKVSYER